MRRNRGRAYLYRLVLLRAKVRFQCGRSSELLAAKLAVELTARRVSSTGRVGTTACRQRSLTPIELPDIGRLQITVGDLVPRCVRANAVTGEAAAL